LKSEWFETFFQGPAVEFWTRAMPPALTLADADFLEKTLARGAPAHLLDIACGNGRHAIELARRGHTLTGVDLSSEFLEAARQASAAAGVAVEWQRGDMRELRLPEAAFDGAYCFGNSFGFLNHPNAEACLKAVARALRPGAKLIIETGTAAESVLSPGLPPKRWHHFGDMYILSECRYVAEWSRLDIDYTFLQGGHSETRSTCSYVMTAGALRELLEQAGFEVLAMQAGIAGAPFQLGSAPLLITAGKE
jgi:ubiquinone/menaquinone biosynthesis C-methylase UbiE